jgi:hypothetical protein
VKGDVIAVIAAVAVVLGFITAVLGLVNQSRIEKSRIAAEGAATLAAQTAQTVETISVSVDGRLSQLLARVAQLTSALEGSDTAVPAPPPTEGTKQ